MAKKATGANKSEVTRKYIAAHPTASVKEIVDGVKAEGTEISVALASKIKYDPSRKGRKKASKRGNKAEAIRQAAKSIGGKVRPRDVIAMLKDQGIKVTSAQVSTTLKQMGMRKTGRGRKPGAPSINIDDLLAAKKLVEQLGSVEAASTALSALAKLS